MAMCVSKDSNFHVLWDIDPWTQVLTPNCDISIRLRAFPRITHIKQHSLTSEGFVLKTHGVAAMRVSEGD